jgi:hypothetical protein
MRTGIVQPPFADRRSDLRDLFGRVLARIALVGPQGAYRPAFDLRVDLVRNHGFLSGRARLVVLLVGNVSVISGTSGAVLRSILVSLNTEYLTDALTLRVALGRLFGYRLCGRLAREPARFDRQCF